ncbi:MAG: YfcE family phosphodiesterase [Lachnospiraceae bacterium]|nr:YfcE family phosphodiesterase [Lachnospiraceae bacterium]
MKIIVISDTHGHIETLDDVLEKEGMPDLLLHCGDICGDEDRLRQRLICPCRMVGGNMDFSWQLPTDDIVEAEGHRIFFAHGHRLGVNFDTATLAEEAAVCDADIALYGHTHVPDIHREQGVTVMNPGSLCFPRQAGRRKSYGVIELAPDREPECEIRYL